MSEENHFKRIYAQQAEDYEAFIRFHDVEGNLLRALSDLHPLEGIEVVEFGAGTGRVTALLAPRVKTIRAFDESEAMLAIAERRLAEANITNATLAHAPNTALPVEDNSADLTIQGWSFGHAIGWYPDSWRDEIGKMLAEMARITRPGGTIINIETQGTGFETPRAPSEGLAAYYTMLEQEHGFEFTWIRTDYTFGSLEQAEKWMRFFFGDEMGEQVVRKNWLIVPECAGIWWKTL
jgi:ubiquinone/menaquinone biosynthesis C-methylase UbiE